MDEKLTYSPLFTAGIPDFTIRVSCFTESYLCPLSPKQDLQSLHRLTPPARRLLGYSSGTLGYHDLLGGGEKQVSNSIIFFWRITLSDERLLIILCNWLKEEHARLSKKIAFLKKDLELEPSDLYVQKSIKEKESQLALITKESIEKYQAFWVPLMPHTRRPCPFCFIHGKTSNLKSVGEENGEESVKCEVCKKQFYFPSGSTS